MATLKNKLILATVTAFSLTSLSLTTNAASFVSNDAQNLTQCSQLVKNEIGVVDSIKTSTIKSKSRSFSVQYKISDNGERSVVECKLAKGKMPEVNCLKGSVCQGVETALTQP